MVVMAANRVLLIPSPRAWLQDFPGCMSELFLNPCAAGESELFVGRHLSTASMDALQGWTWSGYENRTSMTMAAFPIVELSDGGSIDS